MALSQTSYGKSRIRLVRVTRHGDRHELRDFTVAIAFEGSYDTSYSAGDNADVLPTDTMKNTVYALAARDGVSEPEAFGLALGKHFIDRNPKLDRVNVDITAHGWNRITIGVRVRAARTRNAYREGRHGSERGDDHRRHRGSRDHEDVELGLRRVSARRVHHAARNA
jgi:urate oxidase